MLDDRAYPEKQERSQKIEPKFKNRFDKLIEHIKKGEKEDIEKMIRELPVASIGDWLWRLDRYRYKQYALTSKVKDLLINKKYGKEESKKEECKRGFTTKDGEISHDHFFVCNKQGNGKTTFTRGKEVSHVHDIRRFKFEANGMDGHAHEIKKDV